MPSATRTCLWGACLVVAAMAGHPSGAAALDLAHAELDRIVARVNNRIITSSDVRQARMLHLVDDTSSDESTRRALENRILILSDMTRLSGLPPTTDEDLASRRRLWEARVGGRRTEILDKAGMTEKGLDSWLGDDLRIQAYLQRQFGALPEAERARAVTDWIARLRQRAGLR